jgi:hypothetical protein
LNTAFACQAGERSPDKRDVSEREQSVAAISTGRSISAPEGRQNAAAYDSRRRVAALGGLDAAVSHVRS